MPLESADVRRLLLHPMNARIQRLLLIAQLAAGALIAVGFWIGMGLSMIAALTLGGVVAFGFQPMMIGIEFIMAAAVSDAPAHASAGPIGWLRAWLGECVAAARTFSVAQPLLAGRPLASAGTESAKTHLPVLLVHGYFCNRAMWRPMATRLARSGHMVDAVNLEPTFAPIDDYVRQIDAAVRRLQAATGAQRVALVGHSMGGLAIRAWLRVAGDEAMACVITLGTPHAGTLHADFGRAANVQQMRRNSAWLQALAASEPAERMRRFTVIRSWQDNIVAPQGPQTLPDARTVSFTGIGHVRLAYDPRVAAAVIDTLQATARNAD